MGMAVEHQPIPSISLDALRQVIVTASALSQHFAREDLGAAYVSSVPLSDTVFLAEIAGSFQKLSAQLQADRPMFVQHLCPPQVQVELSNNTHDDMQRLEDTVHRVNIDACGAFTDRFLPQGTQGDTEETQSMQRRNAEPVSVQTRIVDEKSARAYQQFDVNKHLASALEQMGYTIDVRLPVWVVSVVVAGNEAYVGMSSCAQNLSNWAGGNIRFKRDPEQVSRAEFKLLEAIEVFDIPLSSKGKALDLGAAPGGWSRLLQQWGYEVWAVDPANLAASLATNRFIHHFREPAQRFLRRDAQFEVIVNDMHLDVGESTGIMHDAAEKHVPGGLAIMTLKVPRKKTRKVLGYGLETLSQMYDIVGVRQLFHNRNEVTVVLRRKTVQAML